VVPATMPRRSIHGDEGAFTAWQFGAECGRRGGAAGG